MFVFVFIDVVILDSLFIDDFILSDLRRDDYNKYFHLKKDDKKKRR